MGERPPTYWIRLAQAKDPAALVPLREYLRREVLPSIRCKLPRKIDIEDFLEDLLFESFLSLPRLRKPDGLKVFLSVIANRRAARMIMEGKKEKVALVAFSHSFRHSEEWRSEPSGLDFPNLEADEVLDSLLDHLTGKERGLFDLIFIKGLSPSAISRRLGLSDLALRQAKLRLRNKLKSVLSAASK